MPDDLEKKIAVLEQKLALYEKDATYRGYYALNKIVNEQVDILNEFTIRTEIGNNPKEDKKYDRVQEIWTKIPAMITNLNALKIELRITGDESKDSRKVPFIEGIATKRD